MNMREKIARAIADSAVGYPDLWRQYTDQAYAALSAMREPTDGMIMAGYEAPQGNQHGCDNKRELASAYMRGPFIAMIDAARGGK